MKSTVIHALATISILSQCSLISLITPMVSTSYCMSARAIRRILASSPRAAGPRASANIMTYSPRTHAITSLLHDEVPIISYWHCGQCHNYIIYWHSGTFELVGYHATNFIRL